MRLELDLLPCAQLVRDLGQPPQTRVHPGLAQRRRQKVTQAGKRGGRIVQARFGNFPQGGRQLVQADMLVDVVDVPQLRLRRLHHSVDIGRIAVDLPVDVIAHILLDPHVFQIEHGIARAQDAEHVGNLFSAF